MAAIEVKVPCLRDNCKGEISSKVSKQFLKPYSSPRSLLASFVKARTCPECKQKHKIMFSKSGPTITIQVYTKA